MGIPMCVSGQLMASAGTSFAAPTMAGIISLINDHRLNNGLPQLGFLNPRLYHLMEDRNIYKECFIDVHYDTVKDDWNCVTHTTCLGCNNGYSAATYWDPQTGFGQPKWDGLLKYFGSDGFMK